MSVLSPRTRDQAKALAEGVTDITLMAGRLVQQNTGLMKRNRELEEALTSIRASRAEESQKDPTTKMLVDNMHLTHLTLTLLQVGLEAGGKAFKAAKNGRAASIARRDGGSSRSLLHGSGREASAKDTHHESSSHGRGTLPLC